MTAVTDIAVASSARGQPWRVLFWVGAANRDLDSVELLGARAAG